MSLKPRIWQHKETKKTFRAMPWWEIPEPLDLGIEDVVLPGRSTKFGVLVQIGWLLENEHSVWFGVNSSAAEWFDDITRAAEPTSESGMASGLK